MITVLEKVPKFAGDIWGFLPNEKKKLYRVNLLLSVIPSRTIFYGSSSSTSLRKGDSLGAFAEIMKFMKCGCSHSQEESELGPALAVNLVLIITEHSHSFSFKTKEQ